VKTLCILTLRSLA